MATYSTHTTGWATTSATDSMEYIWVDIGIGGQYTRVLNPRLGDVYGVNVASTTDTNVDKISKAVTKKDLKMIKDEVRKYMKDQMLKDAKEIAGKLFKDIEELKKAKTQLKKEVTELKTHLKKAQADIQIELANVEEVLERRAASIGKFKYLDLSRDDEV